MQKSIEFAARSAVQLRPEPQGGDGPVVPIKQLPNINKAVKRNICQSACQMSRQISYSCLL